VNALGHAHPHLVAALQEQATKALAHVEPVQEPGRRTARGGLCEQSFADLVFSQFRRGGDGMRDQGVAQYKLSKGHAERYRSSPSRRLSRPDAGNAGRDRLAKISRRLWPPVDGFDQVAARRPRSRQEGDRPDTAGILIEQRCRATGGVRAAPHPFFKALRELCDDDRPAADLRRGDRPAWAAPASCLPTSASASTPDVMSLAKALGGGFPIGACPGDAELPAA
jgi:acetylornithine/N-succinyldiaminopimelate aminotransferase